MTRFCLYRSSTLKRFICSLIVLTLVPVAVLAETSAPGLTIISDTIYLADGSPAQGTLVVTWPAFTTVDNHAVAAGSKRLTIGSTGSVQLALVPNEGAIPAGTFYKVVLKLSDGTTSTEYWAVPAASPVAISAIRSRQSGSAENAVGRLAVPDPVSATDAANKRYVDSSTGGAVYADRFAGATPEAQIDAAALSLGGQVGLVWVPSTMSGGYSTSNRLPTKSLVADFRGCSFNVFSSEAACDKSNGYGGTFWRQTVAEPATGIKRNYYSFQIFQDAVSGGVNQGSPINVKSNFDTFVVAQRSATPGQHQALTSVMMNGSNGDTFAGAFQTYQYGSTNAAGDEGMKALSAYAYQGSEEFNVTVSNVVGNVVTYSSSNNEYSRGEGRYLIVTSRAVYSTGTATVAWAGSTVTGSGTAWAALCPGGTAPCDPNNLFFAMDSGNTSGSQLYAVKVGHITSNTSLTLTWGERGSWLGDATSGTYKIYQGSTVTAIGKAGNLTVADGTQFQASDVVRMPLGNNLNVIAAGFQCAKYLPGGDLTGCVYISDTVGTRPMDSGLTISGKYSSVMRLQPGTAGNLIRSDGPVGTALLMYGTLENSDISLVSINRNATDGGQANFGFNKQYKQWHWEGGQHYFTGYDNASVIAAFRGSNQTEVLRLYPNSIKHNNSTTDTWINGNFGSETAHIYGSTGAADFRDIRLTGGVAPTCQSSNRGEFWYVPGAVGVKDTVEICAKDSGDVYQWVVLY